MLPARERWKVAGDGVGNRTPEQHGHLILCVTGCVCMHVQSVSLCVHTHR